MSEILWSLQARLTFQERWTAHRHDALSEEAVGNETGVATAPDSYRGVDAGALEVYQLQAGRDPHVNVRMCAVEAVKPRDEPPGREYRRNTQDERAAEIVLA